MEHLSFAEMQQGTSFPHRLCAKSNVEKKIGGNGPELKMILNDGSDCRPAKKWRATEAEIEIALTSRFVLVSGRIDEGTQYEGEITLNSIQPADEPKDVKPFLSPFSLNHKGNMKRFSDLIKSVREPNLARLLRIVFNPANGTWEQFKAASAAQLRHHAYRGGLLEHSIEVAELCDKACSVLPNLRRDFLVACALLHDIGKLDEMDHGLGMGEFTECGTLVGHIHSGAFLVKEAADQIPDFPKNLKYALINLMLSHHGQSEWGAAKAPACAEAFVLHECDNMSAKAHECRKLTETARPGQIAIKRAPGEYLYVGDLGLQTPPDEPEPPQPVEVFTTKPTVRPMQTFTTARLTIKGMVAAGSPEQSSEEEEEIREVTIPKNGVDYLLRVTGDSMVDAGLLPDDLLFVKAQETANHGEIVIANLASHGDVVKRLRRDKHENGGFGQDWLDSENRSANYPPIQADEHTRYPGIVVGLLKGP